MKIECGIRYSEAIITGDRALLERVVYKNFGQDVSVGQISSTAKVKIDCSKCPFSDVVERTFTGIAPALQAVEAAESEAKQIVRIRRRGCSQQ